MEESTTMQDMERGSPRVYVALDDHQVCHQSIVVEVEGKIAQKYLSVLIDPVSNHSYVTPKAIQICSLKKKKYTKSQLGQLAT